MPSRMTAYAATEPSTAARMQMRLGRASALTPVQTRTIPAQPQSTEPTVRRSAETVTRPLEQRIQSIMEHSSASRVVKAAAFSRNRGMSRMKSGFFLVAHPSNQFSKSPKNKNSQRIMWYIPHNTLAILLEII